MIINLFKSILCRKCGENDERLYHMIWKCPTSYCHKPDTLLICIVGLCWLVIAVWAAHRKSQIISGNSTVDPIWQPDWEIVGFRCSLPEFCRNQSVLRNIPEDGRIWATRLFGLRNMYNWYMVHSLLLGRERKASRLCFITLWFCSCWGIVWLRYSSWCPLVSVRQSQDVTVQPSYDIKICTVFVYILSNCFFLSPSTEFVEIC